MTTTKFFANITINGKEDIVKLVDTFKRFEFVNNERAEALAELLNMIEDYNAELKANALGTVATSENIINALIPSIELDTKTANNSAKRKRAVYNAIAYTQYRVTEKDGKHEIRAIEKAVTIRDIYAYLCELYASAHADRKVTKEDREKARKTIVNNNNLHALRLFMFGAYRFENVADSLKDFTKIATITDEERKLFIDNTPSKASAEKQIKATASALGLGEVSFKRVHALTLYKRAYNVDKFHQPKVVDILDFTQDFIISARYAKNGIELPETLDKCELFAEIEVKEDNALTF